MSKTIISVGRIYFQLNEHKHTVRLASLSKAIADTTSDVLVTRMKSAIGDTPLQAGEALQSEIARYLYAAIGDTVDLEAFSFTTRRATVDDAGLFWLNASEYLTRLPVTGNLEGML